MSDVKNTIIFITGATGYIGSNVTKRLVNEGFTVHALIRSTSNTLPLHEIENNIHFHYYDGNFESVDQAISTSSPDIVIHLSSLALITSQSKDIENMIQSNILLGTFIAEAMSKHQINKLINTSSYSQHMDQESYKPNSLYAATKQAYEDILLFYSMESKINVISLVLFDNFGPNDPRSKIMNLLYRASQTGSPLFMSPGEQYLDLLYIDDVVNAFFIATKRLLNEKNYIGHKRYAVSNEKRIQLKQLVHIFQQKCGRTIQVEWGGLPYRQFEIMVPWTSGINLPGWSQTYTLEEGIELFLLKNKGSKM